ncbi:uncharacterized protein EDB91DRAFT_374677 [Suillus paluster]|uniref:uncharacterized protein n=1 Tax=Suillus paluster TaxID=48578 RepID=UPI001B87C26C|nr:uncharacterized protein EDB91DRAFT_374677 [Suillus paluster]KAG1739933.1 hypothetical protein EDB91DRAFT_374677 [Suillus paluster]
MSFYAGVVPADGLSAQADINWSHHPQSSINAGAPSAPATQSSSYAAPVTPAQAYARSVLSAQPILQYTIERQQPEKNSGQQPAPLLESPAGASPSARGQSYAQRLYASALGKQPQAQAALQTSSRSPSSSGPGESLVSASARPSAASYGTRASIILNTGQDNTRPQAVSAFDFYHSSVSKLGLQSTVPDRGGRPAGARRPQSAVGSASIISVPHSSLSLISQTTQAPCNLQARGTRDRVPMELSNVPLPSPAGDPPWSNQVELHNGTPPSAMPMLAGNLMPPDPAQIRPQSVSSYSEAIISPHVPPETPPRALSPYSEGHSGDSAQVVAISSNPEPATQRSHPPLAPIRTGSDSGSEDVPLYSLVDDEPPPPDFNESQSICSMTTASTYHDEAPIVLAPPDAPSPTSYEFDDISGAVPLTEPVPGSLQPSSAVEEVLSYSLGKAPVFVKENLHGYSAEDLMPRFPENVPSHSQPRYNATPQDIPYPPVSPAVSTRNDTSAKAVSKTPLPALPPRRAVVSAPAPIAASAPPPTLPIVPPPLSSNLSAVNTDEVRSVTSLPPGPGSVHQPPPLSLRVRVESTFPPSSAFIPPFTSPSAGATSQMYRTASPSPPLPSPPFPQHSQAPSVLSASSTGTHPAEFIPQLPPAVPPTLYKPPQSYYQSPRQSFQPQASLPPPPPQHPRAQTSPTQSPPPQHPRAYTSPTQPPPQQHPRTYTSPTQPPPPQDRAQASPTQPPQSSRGLGTNIMAGLAGGALGLLGGAVLAEALGGDDVVNDLAGGMAGMTFGDPTGGLLDSGMGTGDQMLGSGFDPTAIFQGDQMFSGDSFSPTYDMADQSMGGGIDPGQVQETQQWNIPQTFDVSQSQQQPTDQSGGSHYLHDAGKILQAAYKIYNARGAAQGSQSPQTAAPLQQTPMSAVSGTSHPSGPPNSPPFGHAPMSSTGTYLGTQTSFRVGSFPWNICPLLHNWLPQPDPTD